MPEKIVASIAEMISRYKHSDQPTLLGFNIPPKNRAKSKIIAAIIIADCINGKSGNSLRENSAFT